MENQLTIAYQQSCGISNDRLFRTLQGLTAYSEHLIRVAAEMDYEAREASLCLPNDSTIMHESELVRSRVANKKLKYVILVGIGGSSLGTEALYNASFGHYDAIDPTRKPQLIVLDTIDPLFAKKLSAFLQLHIHHPDDFVVNVVSKSGGTMETKMNMQWILQQLRRKCKHIEQRVVMTTDADSGLATYARQHGMHLLTIPKHVGGRFSVFSTVGLFPLSLLGIDIRTLRAGATHMRNSCLRAPMKKNIAALSASVLFLQRQSGKFIHDTFLFAPALESLGKWYRQLLAESIGKTPSAGITPTTSIGSTDLHSIAQLTFAGPRHTYTTFVTQQQPSSTALSSIYHGVQRAYTHAKLPFMEIVLPNSAPYSLGQFLQFKMLEVMYLGKLFGINAFDQPAVEWYKKEVRKILANKL
ncbi:MAG: hypothetical protein HZB10_03435 [Candidatus Yonathbacteria bacterium]|nr:hypothetical protein [Candidatus Yonathbacteria bacterium]